MVRCSGVEGESEAEECGRCFGVGGKDLDGGSGEMLGNGLNGCAGVCA